MLILPTILSIITWSLCTAFTKQFIAFDQVSLLFSLIPAAWSFWFILDLCLAHEHKFLCPPAYKYNLSKREVLRRLTDYLAETTICQGRNWRQRTLNPDEGTLFYDLAWTTTYSTYSFDDRNHLKKHTERVNLWIGVDIYVNTLDTGSTVVQLAFSCDAEKLAHDCHRQIITTTKEIEDCLGPGLPVPNFITRTPLSIEIPSYVSCLIALLLAVNITVDVIPAQSAKITEAEQHLAQAKNHYMQTMTTYQLK